MITTKIRAIWSSELRLDKFSDDDDFFVLGGHSLAMMRIQRGITAELGVEVPIDQLFRVPTVTAISAYVESVLAAKPTA
ncbi:acyl carrier protein [Streptomyces paradoxus]|uniref:acyl carrier protein n=1 Tax=Streptomyces paradoxus TaxID=66375 RepID=UPI0036FAD307